MARESMEVRNVQRAVEWYALVTLSVVGLSHVWHARAWADAYARLGRLGAAGAFVNGALNLVTGAAIVAGHAVWSGPAVALTAFGWVLVLKGAVCFLVPRVALRSMALAGTGDGRGFVVGGAVMLAFAALMAYALFR